MAASEDTNNRILRLIEDLQSKQEETNVIVQDIVSTVRQSHDPEQENQSHSLSESVITRDPEYAPQSIISNSTETQTIIQQAFKTNCMRESIQHHFVPLVNTLPFKESEIPDKIIEKEITDESEAQILRNLATTEDQVAGLVSTVLRKDVDVVDAFLDIIDSHNAEVVKDVREMYNYLTTNAEYQQNSFPCIIHELKSKCDIKWVYYYMFGNDLISPELNESIIHSKTIVGNQGDLWDEMFNELGNKPVRFVLAVFKEALEGRGNKILLEMIKRLHRKGRPIICTCNSISSQLKLSIISNRYTFLSGSRLRYDSGRSFDETIRYQTKLSESSSGLQLQNLKETNYDSSDINDFDESNMGKSEASMDTNKDRVVSTKNDFAASDYFEPSSGFGEAKCTSIKDLTSGEKILSVEDTSSVFYDIGTDSRDSKTPMRNRYDVEKLRRISSNEHSKEKPH